MRRAAVRIDQLKGGLLNAGPFQEHHGSVARNIKWCVTRVRYRGDSRQHRDGRLGNRKPLRIHRHGIQHALSQVEKITRTRCRSHVFWKISSVMEYLAQPGLPIQCNYVGILVVTAMAVGCEQHYIATGDQLRIPLRDLLLCLVQGNEWQRGAARGGNHSQGAANGGDDHDIAVFTPTCTQCHAKRENVQGRPAV